jgi:hypothetical protein
LTGPGCVPSDESRWGWTAGHRPDLTILFQGYHSASRRLPNPCQTRDQCLPFRHQHHESIWLIFRNLLILMLVLSFALLSMKVQCAQPPKIVCGSTQVPAQRLISSPSLGSRSGVVESPIPILSRRSEADLAQCCPLGRIRLTLGKAGQLGRVYRVQ